MKPLLILYLLIISLSVIQAQDTTLTLTTGMFTPAQQINLSILPGWVYKAGHNSGWASPNLNTANWSKRTPVDLSVKDADQTGRVEGWFRLLVRLDSSFNNLPLSLKKMGWSAADLYLDGHLMTSLGSTGALGKPYQEYYAGFWAYGFDPPFLVELIPQHEHLLAIHWVDYVSPLSSTELKSAKHIPYLLLLLGPQGIENFQDEIKAKIIYSTVWLIISLLMTALSWLLPFQSVHEKNIVRLLVIWGTFYTLQNLFLFIEIFNVSFEIQYITFFLSWFLYYLTVAFSTITLSHILGRPFSARCTSVIIAISVIGGAWTIYTENNKAGSVANFLQSFISVWLLITSWKNIRGAQWATVVGTILSLFFYLVYASLVFGLVWIDEALAQTGSLISVPLSFLVYIVLRFRETLAEVRAQATAIVQVTEEKRELLATQNERLEQQVKQRTAELQASQAQLIQKEKLASLGELTAGIAHEIQNPLNFVNNFSEVSTELVSELQEEEAKTDRDTELIQELLNDLSGNLQKIHHHGGRASSIVKGMLEHSRTSSGDKQPTNLNALCDEYLRIAYHGQRANSKNFNCGLVTDFDPDLGKVELIPQDMGRVLLNLYNNAFYAVQQKQTIAPVNYKPVVTVTTRLLPNSPERAPSIAQSTGLGNGVIEIRIKDNGAGIPESVKAKIFQPFFTTKPTGEGTGLGLSLSYDIITKGHGGSLTVESQPNQETVFTISLPLI